MNPERPTQQVALDELQGSATSAEDQAVLAAWQKEIDDQRAEVLAPVPELGIRPDGTIDTAEKIKEDAQSGDSGHAYGNAGRRA